jgi:endonuclease III
MDAAAEAGAAIEINGDPRRMELDWRHWPAATARGIPCAVNPDAHSVAGLGAVRFGVAVARKGWLEPETRHQCLGAGARGAIPGSHMSDTRRRTASTAAGRRFVGERKPGRRERVGEIIDRLHREYPDATTSLDHRGPYELLVATILSAQCTDARVNMVTPELFARFPTVRDLAAARTEVVEEIIRSTGFFRQKTRSLLGMAEAVVERHGGEIPGTMADLVKLPGVGRKTANVVLGNAFDRDEGVVVDTHVRRLSGRLGLTRHTAREDRARPHRSRPPRRMDRPPPPLHLPRPRRLPGSEAGVRRVRARRPLPQRRAGLTGTRPIRQHAPCDPNLLQTTT